MVSIIHSGAEAEERFKTLPKEIQSLLYSDEMLVVVKKIGDKNQLHIDQVGILETEIGQVMLGFIDNKDFPFELMENLHIERVQADAIAQDVSDMLFSKIRESMKQVAGATNENTGELPTPAIDASVPLPKPPAELSIATHAMLHEATSSTEEAPSARKYKTDPYREPVE